MHCSTLWYSGNGSMGKRKQPISGWFSKVFRYPPISIHFTCISHVCHRFDGVPVSKWLQKPTTVPESLGASDRIAAMHKIQMRRAARSTRHKLRWPTPPIDQGSSRAQDTYSYPAIGCHVQHVKTCYNIHVVMKCDRPLAQHGSSASCKEMTIKASKALDSISAVACTKKIISSSAY